MKCILMNRLKFYLRRCFFDDFRVVSLKSNEFKLYYNGLIFLFCLLFKVISFFYILRIICFNTFTLCLTFILFIIYFKYISKYVNKIIFARRLKHKLKYFLINNDLYRERVIEIERRNSVGDVVKEKDRQVVSSAEIGFKIRDDVIIIRAYKFGDSYLKKLVDADALLSSLLGLELSNKVNSIKYCDYYFNRYTDKRIQLINTDNLGYNNSTVIPLTNNLVWNVLKQPHLLLAGGTGSGKTTFLNFLILEFKKMKADVYIVDPKRSDLASLKNILGDDFVASDVNYIAKVTRIVKELMEQRFITYKENFDNFIYGGSYVDYNLSPVFLIFDELGAFRASADKRVFAETIANLTEIVLKGREMGVFVVLSTQQPNANNIPTELRDNLSVRVALGCMSAEGYRMVFGENVVGLQGLKTVGSGYIFLDGLGWSSPKFFEAPYIDYNTFDFIRELSKYY